MMSDAEKSKRIGRPPKPADEHSDKRPRSIRLSEAHWAELKRRGMPALEAWLARQQKG